MSRAVFLSYASQDADAARRICEALRAAGVEVWFDQAELRGGDAWDQKIRRQIKECALFVPMISANTQARPEGYFRLEWHLAEQRSHLIARGKPFIVPIAIDDTGDAEALVPDAFLAVQWMRLPRGEAAAEFSGRCKALLAGEPPRPRTPLAEPGPDPLPSAAATVAPQSRPVSRGWLILGGIGLLVLVSGTLLLRRNAGHTEVPAAASQSKTLAGKPPASEARQIVDRARAILNQGSLTRAQLDAAGELCDHALHIDPTDPLVWATSADVELRYVYPYGYDRSDERRRRAEERAARATSLGPDLFEVRLIQAEVFAHAVGTPALMAEAEKTIRALHASRPGDPEVVRQLAEVLREEKRFNEAAQLFESVGDFEVAGWSYFLAGELRQALAAVGRAPRAVTALQLRTILEYGANEDLDAAQAVVNQFQPSDLLAELPATTALRVAMYRRDPQRMLDLAQGITDDFIDSNAFRGPRGYFTGLAYEMAQRPAQAEAEWRGALTVVQARLNAAQDDRVLLQWSAWLHAALHDPAGAERSFARSQALAGLSGDTMDTSNFQAVLLQMHVLLRLRKSDALLAGLQKVFRTKLPDWEVVHADLRFAPEADYLRGDPRFQKLLRDTLPEGAKPFPALPSANGARPTA
ncbi:MAG TPA: toll/interleukin-1 receptor domain-containing protein [Opitutaceae bacterium]|nr:toll/interleukin-1 receptor domain-containing protein [Opitutaceae bacterium]